MFDDEKLTKLREILNSVNVTDDHLSRGIRLTQVGTDKIAKVFGITVDEVPALLQACSDMVAKDLLEGASRYTYEADIMGNLTLRDGQTGGSHFVQGDTAFKLKNKLAAAPAEQDDLIAPFFSQEKLNESEDVIQKSSGHDVGTFNFPHKGKFATARFWIDDDQKFQIKVIALTDRDGEPVDFAEEQEKLNAIAATWVDRV